MSLRIDSESQIDESQNFQMTEHFRVCAPEILKAQKNVFYGFKICIVFGMIYGKLLKELILIYVRSNPTKEFRQYHF